MKKIALITGITGQDGSYLAELLLSKDYEVHGIIRRSSSFNTGRINHIYEDPHKKGAQLFLHYGDITDFGVLTTLIHKIQPDEVYNLAAQSHVKVSFELPEHTGLVTGLGTTSLLEASKSLDKKVKFYQASSSEMFGSSPPPQNEETRFHPRSPYAAAKVYSYWMTTNYREAYDMFAVNGILFNHESPRRGETFVSRKITRAVANIIAGNQKKLYLGNLNAQRDWGFAPEYVEFMWKMLQLDKPENFVIGTGETHHIYEFVEEAFNYVNLNYKDYVEIDKKYFRPTEVDLLLADVNKSKRILNWDPKIKFSELVKIMIDYDMKKLQLEPPGEGLKLVEKNGFNWSTIA